MANLLGLTLLGFHPCAGLAVGLVRIKSVAVVLSANQVERRKGCSSESGFGILLQLAQERPSRIARRLVSRT